jgi:hypothetical protein
MNPLTETVLSRDLSLEIVGSTKFIIFYTESDEDKLYIKIIDLYVFDNFVVDYSLRSIL